MAIGFAAVESERQFDLRLARRGAVPGPVPPRAAPVMPGRCHLLAIRDILRRICVGAAM
jgi:hypothetical protein